MGVLISTGVHFRTGDSCRAGLVLNDNPPNYDQCDLSVVTIALGVVVDTAQQNIGKDAASPPDTNGTWHYPLDCPDA